VGIDISFKMSLSSSLYFMRGICIVLMIMGHVIGFNQEHGMRQIYKSDLGFLGWFHDFILTFHIPIFLIVSGIAFATFSKKKLSYKEFLVSKFKKLVIPLICWSSAYFIFQSLYKGEHFSIIDIVKSVIFPYEIFWFLHALIFATFLSFLCEKYFGSIRPYLIISVVLFLACFFLDSAFKVYFYWNIFYAIGVFLSPVLSFLSLRAKASSPLPLFLVLLLSVVTMLVLKQSISIYDVNAIDIVRLVNGSIGFLLIFILLNVEGNHVNLSNSAKKFKDSTLDCFVYLGKMSMIIYLFHGYFTRTTAIIMTKALGLPSVDLYFAVVTAMGVAGPILLYEMMQSKSKIFVHITGGSK